MDKLKNYLFFNPHYHKLSKNELLFQYKNDLNIPSVIKSFQHFHQSFPHFNLNFYKHAYKDLNNKNNQELSIHWINFGQYNNYISNILDFYKCYKDFDYTFYNLHYQLNLDIEEQIIFHYLNEGRFKHYFINKYEFDQSKQNHSIMSNVLKLDNQIDNNLNQSESNHNQIQNNKIIKKPRIGYYNPNKAIVPERYNNPYLIDISYGLNVLNNNHNYHNQINCLY